MPKFVDVHTHTHFAAYENSKEVIDRALAGGVWVVNVGTQKDTSEGAVKIAEQYQEGVYATIGLHPIHTDKSYHDVKELGGGEAAKDFTSRGEVFDHDYYKKLGANKKVVAIGECGLDYYRLSEETKERQVAAFEAQIKLSHELQKPLMIHCRNGSTSLTTSAFSDLIKILSTSSYVLSPIPGIVHFFTGSVDDANKLKDIGFYFSFGGVTTFTKDYDEQIKTIGIERIVLETDAPYVSPVPFRGKRNEPIYIEHTAKAIAEKLGLSLEEVCQKTTENARKALGI